MELISTAAHMRSELTIFINMPIALKRAPTRFGLMSVVPLLLPMTSKGCSKGFGDGPRKRSGGDSFESFWHADVEGRLGCHGG